MMTAKEYIDSLRKMNTRVYMFGEKIDNWVDHPMIRPSINCVAMTYALAQDPQYEELMTATSSLTGRRINRFTHLHQSADDLVKKVKMQRLLGQKTASCFQRCVGMDAFNAVYSTTYEIDEKCGTSYHENFKKFLVYVQDNDLTVDGAMTDPKGDRSKAPHDQADPDMYVHVVERRDDGIVVCGAKCHQTGSVNSHWHIFMPTIAMGEADRDYAVSFACPTDAEGLYMIYGRQSCDTRKMEDGCIDVGNAKFGGQEALVVLDHVFIPNEYIFLNGEYEFAGMMVERFAGYHRQSYGGCKVGVGDVVIGAAALAAVLAPACIIKAVLLVCQKVSFPQVAARIVPAGCAVLGAAVLAVGMAGQVQTRIGGHEGYTFVPELGGWIGDQAEKLATEKELTAGKRLFGTYSSALEAMTGQLQPTGTDYIIHALGDRQRLAYLQTFQQENFDIVVTPSPKVAPPERWSRNANWWFYRELYRYWQPVANTFQSGGMHLFWERTGTDNNLNVETTTAATLQGDGTVLVTVTAADADFCGVADVTLHYGLVSSDSMDHPFDRQFLHVTCVTENELCAAAERDTNQGDFYLPTDRDSYEVPITISNGVGKILLTAKSGSDTVYPQVNAVEVNATYQDWEYFFE